MRHGRPLAILVVVCFTDGPLNGPVDRVFLEHATDAGRRLPGLNRDRARLGLAGRHAPLGCEHVIGRAAAGGVGQHNGLGLWPDCDVPLLAAMRCFVPLGHVPPHRLVAVADAAQLHPPGLAGSAARQPDEPDQIGNLGRQIVQGGPHDARPHRLARGRFAGIAFAHV